MLAKKMEDQKFYMTITAVVAIVAVVGLIMMFGLKKPLGEEVVGKGDEVVVTGEGTDSTAEAEGTEEATAPAVDDRVVDAWVKAGRNDSPDGPGYGELFVADGDETQEAETAPDADEELSPEELANMT